MAVFVNTLVDLDANGRPLYGLFPSTAKKTITFDGGTTNAIGDYTGTSNPFTIFEITGDISCLVIGICKTSLVGAATLEVGVTDATDALIAQMTNDVNALVVNEAWVDATPSLAESRPLRAHIIGGGLDIIGTVGAADLTAGVIDFYCFWQPLSIDGRVLPA